MGSAVAGFLTQPAVIRSALVFAAIIVVISYAMITIQFLVAMVESYVVVAISRIHLFRVLAGSSWTASYADRYIGLAVSNGVKILVIYLLISVGTNLGNAWVPEAQGASTSPTPEMIALDVMAAALMYMMLCWQIPKLFSAVLGGSPALSGGDFIAAGASLIAGGAAVASVASGGAGLVAGGAGGIGGVGAAASAGSGSALSVISARVDVGSTGSGSGSVPPPSPGGSGQPAGPGNPRQPEPPGSSGTPERRLATKRGNQPSC